MNKEEMMKIDLDHFKSIEELERDVSSWVEYDDIYSLNRYINNVDLLTIVKLLKERTEILLEIQKYIDSKEYIKYGIIEVDEMYLSKTINKAIAELQEIDKEDNIGSLDITVEDTGE